MFKNLFKNKRLMSIVAIGLEGIGVAILIYLLFLPFYPAVKYKIGESAAPATDWQNIEVVKEKTEQIANHLPTAEFAVSPNRVIISKIGVNAPIVESTSEQYGLSKGAWRMPQSSTPDKGGNTVITGHRFKYLPPNNLTFYLFHKLVKGDVISVVWQKKNYYYKIKEIKIVKPTDLSILAPTNTPTLTLFTCDPIYSTENRLVIISELIEK